MSEGHITREVVRFGAFEVDLRTEELRKFGQRLRLPGQSFQVLKLLVEKPGQLVSRDELQTKLWPAHTFVDFDHGVNAAVNRLREALGDSADKPRFIETLPRRGYRFIGTLNGFGRTDAAHEQSRVAREHSTTERKARQWLTITGILCLLAIAGTVTYFKLIAARRPADSRVTGAASVGRASDSTAGPTAIRSIAVLPFKPLTASSNDEYLEIGLADTLINRLSLNRQFTIRSTHAIRRYQGRDFDPLAAGREQKVDAVLEGSFQKLGDRVRVTARFVRLEDGSTLWAKRFEVQFADDFTTQDAIAEKVAASLLPELIGEQPVLARAIVKLPTTNAAAHKSYLIARSTWERRTDKTLKAALGHFQRAVELDPNYALAWSGLADCYSMLADHGVLPAKQAYPRAKEAAIKALSLDDSLAEAHTSMAWIKAGYDWDFGGAEKEFRRAIELNPNYATGHQWYAEFLAAMGRHKEAIAEVERAQELEPVSLIINAIVASIYYYSRQYDQALAQCERVMKMDPNFAETYFWEERVYESKGMGPDAARAVQRLVVLKEWQQTHGDDPVTDMPSYWRRRLKSDLLAHENHWRFFAAESSAQLGDKDQAFMWLEKIVEERSCWAIYINVVPTLDPLRDDPRFSGLRKRIGLASAS